MKSVLTVMDPWVVVSYVNVWVQMCPVTNAPRYCLHSGPSVLAPSASIYINTSSQFKSNQ